MIITHIETINKKYFRNMYAHSGAKVKRVIQMDHLIHYTFIKTSSKSAQEKCKYFLNNEYKI